jgi:hypothetical protein
VLLEDAVQLGRESGVRHNGYLLGGFGRYDRKYKLRAVISQIGLGAFTSEQAMYALSAADDTYHLLNGSRDYALPMRTPPPVRGGWSLTVYTLHGGLVTNAIGRYELTNASKLVRSANGTADILLQSAPPANPAMKPNWLPTPAGEGFEIIWRLLLPRRRQIRPIITGRGWQPPAIELVP